MQATHTCAFYNHFLFIISRHKWRHRSWFTILIQRHVDHVAAGNVTYFSCDQVFSHDLDSHFHTATPNVVHLTMYCHHVAYISGGQKIKSFHLAVTTVRSWLCLIATMAAASS